MQDMFTAQIEFEAARTNIKPMLVRPICFHLENYSADNSQGKRNRDNDNARFSATVKALDPSNFSDQHNVHIVLADTLQRNTAIAKKLGQFVESLMVEHPDYDGSKIEIEINTVLPKFTLEAWQESRRAGDTWLEENKDALNELETKFKGKIKIIRWDELILNNAEPDPSYMHINSGDADALARFTLPEVNIQIPSGEKTRLETEYERGNGYYHSVDKVATIYATESILKKDIPYSGDHCKPYLQAFVTEEMAAYYVNYALMETPAISLEELKRTPALTTKIQECLRFILPRSHQLNQCNIEFVSKKRTQPTKHPEKPKVPVQTPQGSTSSNSNSEEDSPPRPGSPIHSPPGTNGVSMGQNTSTTFGGKSNRENAASDVKKMAAYLLYLDASGQTAQLNAVLEGVTPGTQIVTRSRSSSTSEPPGQRT